MSDSGSDIEVGDQPSKSRRVIDDDDELSDIENGGSGASAVENDNDNGDGDDDDNIFGDNDDDDEGEPSASQRPEEPAIGHPLIEVTIPRYPPSHVNSESDSGAYFARVPAFLAMDPKPFDVNKFLDAQEEARESGNEEQKVGLKLQNENTIRWRYARDKDGHMAQQSNARFVKWDDGSMSLQLGSELFDLALKPSDDTFLARSHPTNELLQVYALLDQSVSFIPTSTTSLTHRRLTAELAKRQSSAGTSVRNVITNDDPEKIKREAERAEEMNIRARRKLESKRRQMEELGGLSKPRLSSSSSAAYDRERDNEPMSYGRDEYEEDDFVVDDEDEEEGEGDEDVDEDEDEERAQRLQNLKRSGADAYKNRQVEDEDDDDDDAEDAANSRSKKRRVVDDDSE